jgi:hypothetical protein
MKVWLLTVSIGFNVLLGYLYWDAYQDGMEAAYPICELQYNTLRDILIDMRLWEYLK